MNRIKEILNAQGRSQAWLAEKIGKSYVVTTNYCNNKTQPKLTVLNAIAKALDVDIRELLQPTHVGRELLNVLLVGNKKGRGHFSSRSVKKKSSAFQRVHLPKIQNKFRNR
jgi:putative transcriptional regulator